MLIVDCRKVEGSNVPCCNSIVKKCSECEYEPEKERELYNGKTN